MAIIGSNRTEPTPAGLVYALFFIGLTGLVYALLAQSLALFAAIVAAPLAIIILLYATRRPILSYVLFAIVTCYFSAIYRYARIEGLSGIMDITLGFSLFSILTNAIGNHAHYPWKQGFNTQTLTYLVWLSYCLLILIHPDIQVNNFIAHRSVFLTLPLIYFISGVLMDTPKKLRNTFLLLMVFIFTASIKLYWQKSRGFDSTEMAWLVQGGAWHTHILHTGIRYFSFFTDAGNFGSNMGMFTLLFGLLAIHARRRIMRVLCLGTMLLAGTGMFMSGTRGAIVIPIGGLMLYTLLCKNFKQALCYALTGILAFSFFYFTDIGENNHYIRRMRTAFRPTEDASFNVRTTNKERFAYYLKDRPFGVGVGGVIVDEEGLMKLDEEFIPTDSYYVGIWVQGGIVGLCLYLALQSILLLRCCYIIMFRIKNKQLSLILAVLASCVFGLWLNGYVGNGMSFQPGSFLTALFLSFVLNGVEIEKKMKEKEEIL